MYLQLDKNTESVLQAVRDGYGGMYEDGCLADRRKNESLHIVPANEKLSIPEPVIHPSNCVKGLLKVKDLTQTQYPCSWCENKTKAASR